MAGLYRTLIRPLLFRLDPETAHDVVTGAARAWLALAGRRRRRPTTFGREPVDPPRLRREVGGLVFPLPVGMAAGFDKRGDLFPWLARAGFGFVEVGTFTAVPQAGNPRPRLFRFPAEGALVNRMGFNNPGAAAAARTLSRQPPPARPRPRGVSIGKSRSAPLDQAAEDQAAAMRPLEPFADYWALNVSSPNTPGLRSLQAGDAIARLVASARSVSPTKPLFLKLAPDLAEEEFDAIVEATLSLSVEGLILTNTTVRRDGVPAARDLEGGLSGRPLRSLSTACVRRAFRRLRGRRAIIGVGGIFDVEDALEKILAGADLLEVYTGYVFEGPALPKRLHRGIDRFCEDRGSTIEQLVGQEDQA